jgi:hypothetical protein
MPPDASTLAAMPLCRPTDDGKVLFALADAAGRRFDFAAPPAKAVEVATRLTAAAELATRNAGAAGADAVYCLMPKRFEVGLATDNRTVLVTFFIDETQRFSFAISPEGAGSLAGNLGQALAMVAAGGPGTRAQ